MQSYEEAFAQIKEATGIQVGGWLGGGKDNKPQT